MSDADRVVSASQLADKLDIRLPPMLDGLRRWVECESPTIDPAAVGRMLELAGRDMTEAGAHVERLSPLAIIGRFPHAASKQPGVLIMGHLDTVHPVGTLETLPWRIQGNVCWGPGVNDMKAGNFLALWAARQLRAAGIVTPLPVNILYTGDEEIGSPETRELIKDLARQHKYVLVPEPGRPDGSVVLGRHEILRFTLISTGKPTHAGNTPEAGRSAILQMAEKIVAVHRLSTEGAMFSVGIVNGGLWSNCIATRCTAELLMLIRDPAVRDERLVALNALACRDEDGLSFAVEPLLQRPRWDPDDGCLRLYEMARDIADDLDMALPRVVSGGGSDGNFTGALGLPTLDGLGACGEGHHTLDERIYIDSLVPRTRLMAVLLARLQ